MVVGAFSLTLLAVLGALLFSGVPQHVGPVVRAVPEAAVATTAVSLGASYSVGSGTELTATPVATTAPQPSPPLTMMIAWQPSHQADTGYDGWKEYRICGDIVDRTMKLLSGYRHIKAWDTAHGLTGSNNYRPAPKNTRAFDTELKLANDKDATVFVAIHNDGAAPSGVMGECMPGDAKGRRLAEAFVAQIAEDTGLPSRGVREIRLYSLEPARNHATYRCLLEIGDNHADRKFLESATGRDRIAKALAKTIESMEPRTP